MPRDTMPRRVHTQSDHNKEYSTTHRRVRMTFVASLVPQGGSKKHGLKSFVASLKNLQDSKGVCSSGDSYIDCDNNHVGAFEVGAASACRQDPSAAMEAEHWQRESATASTLTHPHPHTTLNSLWS
jgi:hypothetical protein